MRREVTNLQSFRLNDITALQTGVQRFYVDNKPVEESKFTRHWRRERGIWKMADETDYMINNQPSSDFGNRYVPGPYIPASAELYHTIVKMDSIYFDTYNRCKIAQMDSLTADDIEFYHDRGGFHTQKGVARIYTKEHLWQGDSYSYTRQHRSLRDTGLWRGQFGYHSFRNINEPGESQPSKFVTLWRLKNGLWQITRVISLH